MARVAAGAMFEMVEGGVGDLLVVQGRTGMVARKRPTYRRPTSPGQAAQALRMERAGAFWKALSDRDALEWGRYAEGIVKVASVGGRRYSPTGYNAFMELTLRAIQASPGLVPPSRPPAGPFVGDGTVVRVEAGPPSFRSGERKGSGDGERAPSDHSVKPLSDSPPPAPSSPGTNHPRKEGIPAITFSASGANAEEVVTELRIQPLANRRRKAYLDQYVTARFVAFGGAESVAVPVESGAYACAVRFVERATGQTTAMIELGVVEVSA